MSVLKTLDEDPMNFFPDCVSFAPCVFHSMSGYLIRGGPAGENFVGDDAEWYFKNLARNLRL